MVLWVVGSIPPCGPSELRFAPVIAPQHVQKAMVCDILSV